MLLTAEDISRAESRIRDHVRETPVERARYLEREADCEVYLKLENLQATGSFKVRGAMHKLEVLGVDGREPGVVAASSGNHGIAVAHGAHALRCGATVFVPEGASATKVQAMRDLGTTVHTHGSDCVEAEGEARRVAAEASSPYISPYNDIAVMAGQGSLGVELARQVDPLDALFVALGGGGLISGVAAYLKSRWPEVAVVACSPERSPAMHACLQAGHILDVVCHETLSDATAGGVESGSVTFETCRDLVDESLLVSELEIKQAMSDFIGHQHQLLEGAAGVALAGFRQWMKAHRAERVGIVICGANIGRDTLQQVLT